MSGGPRTRPVGGVVLTHGAGSDRDHPSLIAIERALAPQPVRRMNFSYRDAPGRRPPDRAPKLLAELETSIAAFGAERRVRPHRIVLGGRSMGGRMCSMLVAAGHPAAALVLVGYPLHPPGKPDRLRVEHLPQITVPCLFVSGTRDQFGSPDELTAATAAIAGPVTHRWIEGGRHELKGADDQVAGEVAAFVRSLG